LLEKSSYIIYLAVYCILTFLTGYCVYLTLNYVVVHSIEFSREFVLTTLADVFLILMCVELLETISTYLREKDFILEVLLKL